MSSSTAKLHRLARLRWSHLRAMAWSFSALRAVRSDLKTDGTRATVAAPPPGLPNVLLADVRTVLNLRHATCLERSLVVQRWLTAHGTKVPVVIGVANEAGQFSAHAWLPGIDRKRDTIGFTEIRRIEP